MLPDKDIAIRFYPLSESDRFAVIDIYNLSIKKSFAAYPSDTVGYSYFDYFLQLIGDYPAYTIKTDLGIIVGFAFLHPYRPISTFRDTAEITYFIIPEYTNQGLGTQALKILVDDAVKRYINKILAGISSLNEQSIKFHLKEGFVECGRFPGIGTKFNQTFDVVWMIKIL